MAGQVVFPRPGGVVGGKYVLEAMLDSSAAGAVFRARHVNTGRPFAIRWLTRTTRSNASVPPVSHGPEPVAENYQNPLLLSPLDVGRTPHGAYIVMEWLNGETLASRLVCEGAMTPSAAATILVPCLRAVHDMHLAYAVHGDLRPGNIFICRGVEQRAASVRVFDYSIAGASCLPARLDADGGYSREAHFLAPEQLTNSPVDHRADVYAFGVMLYECLTGQLPFMPDRSDDFARWIYGQDPPALPGAPGLTPALYRLLTRAMARDASDRFDSCLELADALEELARQSIRTVVSVQPTRVIRSSRPTMRLASELPLPLPQVMAPNSLRATVSRIPVVSNERESDLAARADTVPLRTVLVSAPGPGMSAANDNAMRPSGPRATFLSSPPPAANVPGAKRPSSRPRSLGSVPPPAANVPGFIRPTPRQGSIGARAAEAPWPLPAARLRVASRPPMPARPIAYAHSQQPPASSLESTLPLEVLRPQDRRKPVSRGALLGSACFLALGVVPLVGYFAPPSTEREELEGMQATPSVPERAASDRVAAAAPATALVLPTEADVPTSAVPAANVVEAAPPKPPFLVDDPTTPIDESDPLIAAALAAQDEDEASLTRKQAVPAEQTSPAPEPPSANIAKGSGRAKPTSTVPAAPKARPRKSSPRQPANWSLTAEPYKSVPVKRLHWESPKPSNR